MGCRCTGRGRGNGANGGVVGRGGRGGRIGRGLSEAAEALLGMGFEAADDEEVPSCSGNRLVMALTLILGCGGWVGPMAGSGHKRRVIQEETLMKVCGSEGLHSLPLSASPSVKVTQA